MLLLLINLNICFEYQVVNLLSLFHVICVVAYASILTQRVFFPFLKLIKLSTHFFFSFSWGGGGGEEGGGAYAPISTPHIGI